MLFPNQTAERRNKMSFWKQYTSPLGYVSNGNLVDTYGVDHSGFTTRDELQYQTARINRENDLMTQMNNQGMTTYPQYGTNFWGSSADNNYGFGSSNIGGNIDKIKQTMTPIPQMSTQPSTPQVQQQPDVWADQNKRNAENSLLMSGLDTLYGTNRAINGATFGGLDWLGNKLGIDTQMNEYMKLKDTQGQGNIARTTGQLAEYGSGGLSAGAIGKATYEPANMAYNGYKIGKAYDRLSENPFAGTGSDVIAKMKNHAGEPVVLQRGEAMLGENGNVVTSGRPLQHVTGTSRNYGLDKIIYKHEMPRNEVTQIPKYLRNNKPIEVTARNQHIYNIYGKKGDIKIATTPQNGYRTISSMYIKK